MSGMASYAAAFIGFLITLGVVWVVGTSLSRRFGPEAKALEKRLNQVAEDRRVAETDQLIRAEGESDSLIAKWLSSRQGTFEWLRLLIVQSGSKQSVSGVLASSLLFGAAVMVVGLLLIPDQFFATLFFAVLATGIPVAALQRQKIKRTQKFESQLPDALDFISRALRAGFGMSAAMNMLGDEFPEPLGPEFALVADETNFGLSIDQALTNLTSRVESDDLHFFVIALLIQRETGSNLAELFSDLANTVRERIKLAGKVRVISAEGRISGMVIGVLPFAMGLIFTAINPNHMAQLWTTVPGVKMLVMGLIAMAVGGLWIWRIVTIKV